VPLGVPPPVAQVELGDEYEVILKEMMSPEVGIQVLSAGTLATACEQLGSE
jgi:hypothetical protein